MTRAARFTQADITRAVKGAQQAGLIVAGVEITPDGIIRVITAEGAPTGDDWRSRQPGLRKNPLDRLFLHKRGE